MELQGTKQLRCYVVSLVNLLENAGQVQSAQENDPMVITRHGTGQLRQ